MSTYVLEVEAFMVVLKVPNLSSNAINQFRPASEGAVTPTVLYSQPPAKVWNAHPTEVMTPRTPAAMWPWESMEMVLIRPAEPVAGEGRVSETVGTGEN